MSGTTHISELEELIHALEMGKPAFDGEAVNYDVATIEDAVEVIKQYVEIIRKVEEYYTKTKRDYSLNTVTVDEFKAYLKECESHQLCLANQILDILQEKG